jgi:hypothetical protein
MNPTALEIEVRGIDDADFRLQAVSRALANREPLHAKMATTATDFTREFLVGTPRHRTAERLGATPTGFRAKNARAIQPDWDIEAAILRIPRSTGLARAFGDVVIEPKSGRKYLTIPDHAETYGRSVRDFPEGTFNFAILYGHRPFPVLIFAEDGGRHLKGEVGYWLRKKVTQKQDRSLLPSDAAYREISRRVIVAYIANLVYYAP